MSDAIPATPEPVVDQTLRRRVAWGLAAGFAYDEVARREGITRAALDRILARPGMIVLLRVWTTFFQEGDRGDIPLLLEICRWALRHIARHAPERAVGVGVGFAFIATFCLQAALKPTLKALCAHIEGVIELGPPKRLRGMRAKLADILCWVLETALTQDLIDKFGDDYLAAQDTGYAEAVRAGRLGRTLLDPLAPPGAEAGAAAAPHHEAETADATTAERALRACEGMPLQHRPGRKEASGLKGHSLASSIRSQTPTGDTPEQARAMIEPCEDPHDVFSCRLPAVRSRRDPANRVRDCGRPWSAISGLPGVLAGRAMQRDRLDEHVGRRCRRRGPPPLVRPPPPQGIGPIERMARA